VAIWTKYPNAVTRMIVNKTAPGWALALPEQMAAIMNDNEMAS